MDLRGLFVLKSDVEKHNKNAKIVRINTDGYKMSEALKIFHIGMPKLNELIKSDIIQIVGSLINNNGTITNYLCKEQVDNYLINLYGWSEKEVKEYIHKKTWVGLSTQVCMG